jgi:hypothetical protein
MIHCVLLRALIYGLVFWYLISAAYLIAGLARLVENFSASLFIYGSFYFRPSFFDSGAQRRHVNCKLLGPRDPSETRPALAS